MVCILLECILVIFHFFQKKDLSEVINLECGHRCRADPIEATTYSLKAEGKGLKKFKAEAAAKLKVKVEKQDKVKKETYHMQVPLNLSPEYVAGKVFTWT